MLKQKDPKDYKKAFDFFQEFLRQKGLNSTKQRDTIVQLFLKSQSHLSAEELYDQAKTYDENIGITTVYRTLKLLQDAGLASEHKFYGNTSRFEFMDFEHHHDHMICTNCGDVVEFQADDLDDFFEKLASNQKFLLTSHKLELFGICPQCDSKKFQQ